MPRLSDEARQAFARKFRSYKGTLSLIEISRRHRMHPGMVRRICRDYEVGLKSQLRSGRPTLEMDERAQREQLAAARTALRREIELARAEAATAPPYEGWRRDLADAERWENRPSPVSTIGREPRSLF